MITKKEFSQAIQDNASVVAGAIPVVSETSNGLMSPNLYKFGKFYISNGLSGNKFVHLCNIRQYSIIHLFAWIGPIHMAKNLKYAEILLDNRQQTTKPQIQTISLKTIGEDFLYYKINSNMSIDVYLKIPSEKYVKAMTRVINMSDYNISMMFNIDNTVNEEDLIAIL